VATAYFQPTFESQYLATKAANLSAVGTTEVLKVGLIASGTLAARSISEGYATVSALLSNNGSALTEVVGGGYSRYTLVAASTTYSTTGLVNTLTTSTNPSWPGATFSTVYGFLYDYTAGGNSDTAGALICIWDWGGAQSVTSTNFTLSVNASGLVTWTAAQ
jgi:hypothetical protein